MVHFTWFSSAGLFYSPSRYARRRAWVTPFGHPRITGYVLLPAAFRSLSRPSSPCGSTGIRHRPIFRLTILSFPPRQQRSAASRALPSSLPVPLASPRAYLHATHALASAALFFPSLFLSKNRRFFQFSSFQNRMEIRGLEPLTLGLQSRCSSQLS